MTVVPSISIPTKFITSRPNEGFRRTSFYSVRTRRRSEEVVFAPFRICWRLVAGILVYKMEATLSRLITAVHILHHQKILDEQGHISVRNPYDASTFFTSTVPAILVSSKNDIHQWHVGDCSPVATPYSGCQVVEVVPEFSEHYID